MNGRVNIHSHSLTLDEALITGNLLTGKAFAGRHTA